jgi:hypothetical protein
MLKKLTLCALVCGLVMFNSCKPKDNDQNTEETPIADGMVRLDLSKSGIMATIDVPDTTNKQHGIEASSSGAVNVFVGNGFHITINVSGETVAMKKSDANGDDINKPKQWVVSDSSNLLYSTQKDTNAFANAKEEFHIYSVVKKGTASYYIEDIRQSTDGTDYVYSQQQAQLMLASAKTIMPKAAPAKKES